MSRNKLTEGDEKKMETKLVKDFSYNGLGFRLTPKLKPEKVKIVGVNIPVDPGLVVIESLRTRERKEVPTIALEDYPKIDFNYLLSKKQKLSRKNMIFLFGDGVNLKNKKKIIKKKLIPLHRLKIN